MRLLHDDGYVVLATAPFSVTAASQVMAPHLQCSLTIARLLR
jgi:hypothetical protein